MRWPRVEGTARDAASALLVRQRVARVLAQHVVVINDVEHGARSYATIRGHATTVDRPQNLEHVRGPACAERGLDLLSWRRFMKMA